MNCTSMKKNSHITSGNFKKKKNSVDDENYVQGTAKTYDKMLLPAQR